MRNVVITGVGIKSCIGNTYQEVLDSLKNGKSGITANETYKEMGFIVLDIFNIRDFVRFYMGIL